MKRRSKFEADNSSNDIIGLGFNSDSENQEPKEYDSNLDTMGPNKSQKPFIELFNSRDDKFDLTGSRRFGHIPEDIDTVGDELLESQGAEVTTRTYCPENNKTVIRDSQSNEWVE